MSRPCDLNAPEGCILDSEHCDCWPLATCHLCGEPALERSEALLYLDERESDAAGWDEWEDDLNDSLDRWDDDEEWL